MRSYSLPISNPDSIKMYRIRSGQMWSSDSDGMNGFFLIPGLPADGTHDIKIIASDGKDDETQGWEHVSVSLTTRTPTWEEMARVKHMFWESEECVIQFHPPESKYKRQHPYVLHMWKPPYDTPTPPEILI